MSVNSITNNNPPVFQPKGGKQMDQSDFMRLMTAQLSQQDPFNPVGRACPYETAGLMIMTSHLLPGAAWDTVSSAAAAVMQRPAGGLCPGRPADLVATPASDLREAIAFGPGPRLVWREGLRTA